MDVDFSNYLFETSDSSSLLEDVSSLTVSFDIDVSSISISTASRTTARSRLPWSENHSQSLCQYSNHSFLDEEGRTNEEAALDIFATLLSPLLSICPFQGENIGYRS